MSSLGTAETVSPTRHIRIGIIIVIVIIVLAIVAGIANTALLTRNDHRPYSPDSLDPEGGAALAHVLTNAGIDVVHTQTADELARASSATTVLLTNPLELDEKDVSALQKSGATVILLGASSWWDIATWGFGDDAWTSALAKENDSPAQTRVSALACTPATLTDGDGSTLGPVSQIMIRAHSSSHCFDISHGSAWVQSGEYPQVFYFGAASALTNRYLGEFDNAGIALRALGQHPTLLWVEGYTPGSGAPPALGELPPWLSLAFVALLASGAWLVLVRARRFGKLVAEPLPVAVPADEANIGRAQLYRANRDIPHAARVLRSAFISRYARRVGLSPHADPSAVALAFASACHSDPHDIMRTLYTQPIHTHNDLAHLASAVGDLEKELTHGRSSARS